MTEWRFVPDSTVEVCSDGRVRRDGVEFVPCQNGSGYLILKIGGRKGKMMKLHRLIAAAFIPNLESKPCVDHINNETLDNRVSNLRWATIAENVRNRRRTSGALPRGVSVKRKRFRARVNYDGIEIALGCFDTPEEASAAYEAKAQELYGEFYKPPY